MARHRIPDGDTIGLLAAYLDARYRADTGGAWLELRIGQAAPAALEAALPAAPGTARTWTLLTAWNPQSRPLDPAANHAADAVLQVELDALRLSRLPATGGSPDGRWQGHAWHELGWLVAGLDTAGADALARRHDQAGILHWHAGKPVRLRMYRPRPPGTDPACVDWLPPL